MFWALGKFRTEDCALFPYPIVLSCPEDTASRRPILTFKCTLINPLKTKRICFIQALSAYRAVNTLHFGYKNQSLNVL
jgi:hypothetical protein